MSDCNALLFFFCSCLLVMDSVYTCKRRRRLFLFICRTSWLFTQGSFILLVMVFCGMFLLIDVYKRF